jgi:hypothetical protein
MLDTLQRLIARPTVKLSAAVYGLYLFAVVKPLLDMLVDAPGLFIVHGMTSWQIFLALLALFAAPALVIAPWLLLRRLGWQRLAEALLVLVVLVLSALAVAAFLKQAQLPLGAGLTAVASLIAALGVAFAVLRRTGIVDFLGLVAALALLPLVYSAHHLIPALAKPASIKEVRLSGKAAPINVLLIIFDELNTSMIMSGDGGIDAARYPGFARLLNEGSWYRQAASVACYTELAVPAILTGSYPQPSRAAPTYHSYPYNLFSLLASTHAVQAWEPITHLCPAEVCSRENRFRPRDFIHHLLVAYAYIVTPRQWTSALPDLQNLWITRNFQRQKDQASAGDRRAQVENFIAALGHQASGSWLKMVHLALPHAPFEYVHSGQNYFLGSRYLYGSEELPGGTVRWLSERDHVNQTYYRHLLQMQYADSVVERALQRLQEAGESDNTMVVVTADHGVAYHEGWFRRETTDENYVFQAAVPLLVKYPGRPGGIIIDKPVLNIDILPSILKQLGVSASGLDGEDLDTAVSRSDTPATFRHACVDVAKHNSQIEFKAHASAMLPALEAEAKRAQGLFGGGPDPRPLFSPHGNWVGQAPEQVAEIVASDGDAVVYYPRAQNWAQVDPEAGWLPLHLDGSFELAKNHPAAPPYTIAVAVNGKIANVMPTIRDGGQDVMSMMIAKQDLRPGNNDLAFYQVLTTGTGKPRLKRLELIYR